MFWVQPVLLIGNSTCMCHDQGIQGTWRGLTRCEVDLRLNRDGRCSVDRRTQTGQCSRQEQRTRFPRGGDRRQRRLLVVQRWCSRSVRRDRGRGVRDQANRAGRNCVVIRGSREDIPNRVADKPPSSSKVIGPVVRQWPYSRSTAELSL